MKNRRIKSGIASLASLKVLFLIVSHPTSLQYLPDNLYTSFDTNLFIKLKIKILYGVQHHKKIRYIISRWYIPTADIIFLMN